MNQMINNTYKLLNQLMHECSEVSGKPSLIPQSSLTCRAVALSKVLRTALVSYGNMATSTPHSSETSQVWLKSAR